MCTHTHTFVHDTLWTFCSMSKGKHQWTCNNREITNICQSQKCSLCVSKQHKAPPRLFQTYIEFHASDSILFYFIWFRLFTSFKSINRVASLRMFGFVIWLWYTQMLHVHLHLCIVDFNAFAGKKNEWTSHWIWTNVDVWY